MSDSYHGPESDSIARWISPPRISEVTKLKKDKSASISTHSDFDQSSETLDDTFGSTYGFQKKFIDSIEDNIIAADCQVNTAHVHLKQAICPKTLGVLVPVAGCITGALVGGPLGFVIGGKLCGLTVGCVSSIICLFSSIEAQRCSGSKKMKSD